MFTQLFTATLSLLALTPFASEDGEKFSEDGDETHNNGFGMSYFQDSGRPVVLFYGSGDQNVYCLEFRESFEAEDYVDADTYEQVSDSKIDFADIDWSYENNNDSNAVASDWDYRIYAPMTGSGNDAKEGKLQSIEFVFYREETTLGEGSGVTAEALKFDINLAGYTWETQETTKENNTFVIEFRLEDCSDEYSAERVDSDEHPEDQEDTEDTEDTEDPAAKRMKRDSFLAKFGRNKFVARRRLGEGEISAEHSNEFDMSQAFFTVARTATDESGAEIDVGLDYSSSGDRLTVAFDYFGASVHLDPAAGVRSADSGDAAGVSMAFAALFSAVAAVLAW